LVLLLGLTAFRGLQAAGPWPEKSSTDILTWEMVSADQAKPDISRGMAALLAVTLGPFGGHRVYLGARPKVPLVYGITFGGFGVLVVLDLGHILFTKDLDRFRDNDRVFMWTGPKP
jgi:hypothetical protein